MDFTRVDGRDEGEVVLFALSTCVWCRRTRRILDRMGVAYSYVYVDRLPEDDRKEAVGEMRKYNPSGNFPTVVIDGDKVIAGHSPDELRLALGG